jgi:hypothetical protein
MLNRARRLCLDAILIGALLANSPAQAATEVASVSVIPQASTAVETSHVVAAYPAPLRGASITTGASAGYFMAINETADSGNGAVKPLLCVYVAATSTGTLTPPPNAQWAFSVGIVLVFSTTGCFTETQSATAYFSWE